MRPDFIFYNLGTIVNVRVCTADASEEVARHLDVGVEDVVENHRPGSEYTLQLSHLRAWAFCDHVEDSGRFVVETVHPGRRIVA